MSKERDELRLTVARIKTIVADVERDRDEVVDALVRAGLACGDEGPGGVRCQRPKAVPHGHGHHVHARGRQRRTW